MTRQRLATIVALVLAFVFWSTRFAVAATVSVSDGWSRPAIEPGVAYFTIRNDGVRADRLIGAASPVAKRAELHQTHAMSGMSGMSGMTMAMTPVATVDVPARGRVAFAPGGYHVMLIGLRAPLRAGETFPLRLHFSNAGWVTTSVRVRSL